jgi:hypothetical protein
MSSVQICSVFTGRVGVTTKQGKTSTVTFYEKHDETGPIGFAEVTHEQAEQFMKIPSEYWKPGHRLNQPVDTLAIVEAAVAADPAAQKAADDLLGGPRLTLATIPDDLREEMRQQLLAEMKDESEKKDTRTPAEKARDTREAKKSNLAAPFGKKEEDPAIDPAIAPLLEAIKLAESDKEVDAVVGTNDSPVVTAAATERKAEIKAA